MRNHMAGVFDGEVIIFAGDAGFRSGFLISLSFQPLLHFLQLRHTFRVFLRVNADAIFMPFAGLD